MSLRYFEARGGRRWRTEKKKKQNATVYRDVERCKDLRSWQKFFGACLPFYMPVQFSSSHIQTRVLARLLRSCDHSAVGSLYARGRLGHRRLNPWLHLQRGLRKRKRSESLVDRQFTSFTLIERCWEKIQHVFREGGGGECSAARLPGSAYSRGPLSVPGGAYGDPEERSPEV